MGIQEEFCILPSEPACFSIINLPDRVSSNRIVTSLRVQHGGRALFKGLVSDSDKTSDCPEDINTEPK